jgi:hypothetical protein
MGMQRRASSCGDGGGDMGADSGPSLPPSLLSPLSAVGRLQAGARPADRGSVGVYLYRIIYSYVYLYRIIYSYVYLYRIIHSYRNALEARDREYVRVYRWQRAHAGQVHTRMHQNDTDTDTQTQTQTPRPADVVNKCLRGARGGTLKDSDAIYIYIYI